MNPLDYLKPEILAESYLQTKPERIRDVYNKQDKLIGIVVNPVYKWEPWKSHHNTKKSIIIAKKESPLIKIQEELFCIEGIKIGGIVESKNILKKIIDECIGDITDRIIISKYHVYHLKRDSQRIAGFYHFTQKLAEYKKILPLYIPKQREMMPWTSPTGF